jgi:hypothetical protein
MNCVIFDTIFSAINILKDKNDRHQCTGYFSLFLSSAGLSVTRVGLGEEHTLTENMQRKSLDSIEEAMAYKKYVVNFGWRRISDLAAG